MPPIRTGLNLKFVNSQLNAYGYKIARKDADDDVDIRALEDIKEHFKKRGERPEIKLKFAPRPPGTVGRGEFQVERIIELSEDDVKFIKQVLKTYLFLDPDIDTSKPKGKNLPGAVKRVIHKSVRILGEFDVFETHDYWPLHAFVLALLKSTSQTARGYGAQSRERKKKLQEERRANGITTDSPAKPTGAKIGRPRKQPYPRVTVVSTSDKVEQAEVEQVTSALGNSPSSEPAEGKAEGERVKNGAEDAEEDGEEPEHVGDTTMGDLPPPARLEAANEDEEFLAEGISGIALDEDGGEDEAGQSDAEEVLPTRPDLVQPGSTVTLARSRTTPFIPSAPPRRAMQSSKSKLPTSSPPDSSHHRVPTTTTPKGPDPTAKTSLDTPPPVSNPPSSTSASIPGMTPEILVNLASLPACTLATFPLAVQVAIAQLKASSATGAPDPPFAPNSAQSQTLPRAKRPPPKAPSNAAPTTQNTTNYVPPGADFNDEDFASDPESASEANPPVNSKSKKAPINAAPPQPSGKTQELPPSKPRGKKGSAKAGDQLGGELGGSTSVPDVTNSNEPAGNIGKGVSAAAKRAVNRKKFETAEPKRSTRASAKKEAAAH